MCFFQISQVINDCVSPLWCHSKWWSGSHKISRYLEQLTSNAKIDTDTNHQNVHDDVIKWKHFPRYWFFVRGIHRSPVNSPHKGQWRGALLLTLICARINGWVNNREAGDLRRHRAHYDVIVMLTDCRHGIWQTTREYVLRHNAEAQLGTWTYTQTLNKFADFVSIIHRTIAS